MTEKMYDNLQEKYEINVLQILKIYKITILERLVILILIRQLRKKITGGCLIHYYGIYFPYHILHENEAILRKKKNV